MSSPPNSPKIILIVSKFFSSKITCYTETCVNMLQNICCILLHKFQGIFVDFATLKAVPFKIFSSLGYYLNQLKFSLFYIGNPHFT